MAPRWAAALVLLLVVADPVTAQRLPVRTYTTADGLPTPMVTRITRDSRGFMWFATRDGISRFDGVDFVNYSTRDGLPLPTINYVIETADGEYLVATNGAGILRFRADPSRRQSRFEVVWAGASVAENRVNTVLPDRDGRLWFATDGGAFVLEPGASDAIRLRPQNRPNWRPNASFVMQDSRGTIWFSSEEGLLRAGSPDRVEHIRISSSAHDIVNAVAEAPDEGFWIAHDTEGLYFVPHHSLEEFRRHGSGHGSLSAVSQVVRLTAADGLAANRVTALHLMPDGTLWAGTADGVSVLPRARPRVVATTRGLPTNRIYWFCRDAAGDLWLAGASGAHKITLNGFTTFDRTDGLPDDAIHALYTASDGSMRIVSGHYQLTRFDGRRFTTLSPPVETWPRVPWLSQVAHPADDNDWWLLGPRGLLKYSPDAGTLVPVPGLTEDVIYRVHATAAGELWAGAQHGGLARLHVVKDLLTQKNQLSKSAGGISALGDDEHGGVWVGFTSGRLARVDDDGLAWFDLQADSVAPIAAIHSDRSGRLWIATSGAGVMRIDDPRSNSPTPIRYSAADGMASDNVRCIIEDLHGRVYFGTVRGINRLDVDSGSMRHYTTLDGLAHEFVIAAARTANGDLWFGTQFGLSRLVPTHDHPRSPPSVWISQLRVDGAPLALSELGESRIGGLLFQPWQDSVELEVVSVAAGMGETVRFQYRIDDESEWSEPTTDRRFAFARLAPGNYVFQVRAMTADGTVTERPAVVAFRILPPLWARWWFLLMVTMILAAVALQWHRFRIRQLIALERVRTRIAADLHDDIGSNLSKITLLTEVLKREPDANAARARAESIARVANESIDAMADIIWAVDPTRDRGGDLVQRMRRHAEEALPPAGITLHFAATADFDSIRLDTQLRREVLLIFKEAVHNLVRHARCTQVRISIALKGRTLAVEIADDGRGFVEGSVTPGRGLASMAARARRLGGTLHVASAPGTGTTIGLTVPVTAA